MNKNLALSMLLFLAAALIIMLSGCASPGELIDEPLVIPFAIQVKQVWEDEVLITISNDSNETMFFGGCNDYLIEKKEGMEWKIVQEKQCVWEGQAKALLAGKSTAFYETLNEFGTYRIRLDFGIGCEAEYPLSQANCGEMKQVFSREFLLESGKEFDFFSCAGDSECTKTSEGCCLCNAGGKEIAINKDLERKYRESLECPALVCTQLYACTEREPKCERGRCVLR